MVRGVRVQPRRPRVRSSVDAGEVERRFARRGGFDWLEPIWWHSNGDGDPLAHPPEPEGAHERTAGIFAHHCY